MAQFTRPDEVAAQVKTFAWLVGNMDNSSALSEDDSLGLLCIGNMISENVDTMIKDFQDQVNALREQKIEVPE